MLMLQNFFLVRKLTPRLNLDFPNARWNKKVIKNKKVSGDRFLTLLTTQIRFWRYFLY